jgi:hypothetical protein
MQCGPEGAPFWSPMYGRTLGACHRTSANQQQRCLFGIAACSAYAIVTMGRGPRSLLLSLGRNGKTPSLLFACCRFRLRTQREHAEAAGW